MTRWIFLSGMMGTGKSTVGRVLAARLGQRFVDLDERIEARVKKSVRQIFMDDGEATFRRLEAEEALGLLAETPAVVALGGGTVVNAAVRRALLARGVVVTLSADTPTLIERARRSEARPMLDGPTPEGVLHALLEARRDAYAECHATFDTRRDPPETIAERIEALVAIDPIVVPLGRRSYTVDVRRGALGSLGEQVRACAPSHVLLVTDERVDPLYGEQVRAQWTVPSRTVVLSSGEAHKTLAAVTKIWDAALAVPIDRDALVLVLGGGVPGDLAGFAAATLLRGVRFAQCPTTLLAMSDASVGGKTGFDHAGGKNLVGAFHQPAFVTCSIETIETLAAEELRSGLGEVVKAAWLDSDASVSMLERDAEALLARDHGALTRAVRMAVRFKAEVVAGDEREGGRRAILNLGHTLGHAIESAQNFVGLRHGEAVSVGMVAACDVALGLGVPDAARHRTRLVELLSRLGLPNDPSGLVGDEILQWIGSDKKRRGGAVRFVVPRGPGEASLEDLRLDEVANLFRARLRL